MKTIQETGARYTNKFIAITAYLMTALMTFGVCSNFLEGTDSESMFYQIIVLGYLWLVCYYVFKNEQE